MSGRFSVKLHDEAEKQLARLDRRTRDRVLARIDTLQYDSHPHGAEPLSGRVGILRLRVGRLRIVYRLDDSTGEVFIEGITPRGQAYKGRRLQRL